MLTFGTSICGSEKMRSSSAFCGSSFGAEAKGRIGSSGCGAIRSRTGSLLSSGESGGDWKCGSSVGLSVAGGTPSLTVFGCSLGSAMTDSGQCGYQPVTSFGYRLVTGLPGSEFQAVLGRKLFERDVGPGADMLDHLGGRDRAEPGRVTQAHPLGMADQEAGGEQIAGAG